MLFFSYFLIVLFVIVDVFLFFKFFEYAYCIIKKKQPPFVPSNNDLRMAVVKQINNHYKDAKLICEVGSGFGALSRYIAKNTNAEVIGLENMPLSAFFSKFLDFLSDSDSKTIWCDAYEYLDKTDKKFDIVVAYMGPEYTNRLKKYNDKIKVIISLDFEMNNMKPNRVIDLGGVATIYNRKKYPHRLYIYEFHN